jgi:hypothetical protein
MYTTHIISNNEPPKRNYVNTAYKVIFSVILLILFLATSIISYRMGRESTKQSTDQVAGIYTQNPKQDSQLPSYTEEKDEFIPPDTESEGIALAEIPINLTTRILTVPKNMDGVITSNSAVDTANYIKVGRDENSVHRTFLSFDLSPIPSGAKVTNAVLRIYQTNISGRPFDYGPVMIDHINFGETLTAQAYSQPALILNYTTLSKNETIGWKEADVTKLVIEDLALARSKSQIRLHLQKEITGGAGGDFVFFESSGNFGKTGYTPQLVVTY